MSRARTLSLPIRYALPGILSILIILAVGLTAWLSFRSGQTTANEMANNVSRKVIDQISERVISFMETPQQFHEMNLAAVRAGIVDLNDFSSLEKFFWNQVFISESVPYVYYGNEQGDFVGVDTNFGTEGPVYKIRDANSAPNRLTYKLDSYGNVVGDPTKTEDYDPRKRPWYQAAIETGAATWSPIYTSAARNDLQITPVMPVYDANETLQGVFGINLTLADLTTFLRSLKPSPNGRAFIIEYDGSLVATSAPDEQPFKVVTTTDANGKQVDQQERLNVTESKDPLINAAANFLGGKYGSYDKIAFEKNPETGSLIPLPFNFDFQGQNQIGQIVPITDSRGLNWIIVTVLPANDFMVRTYESIRTTLYFGLLVLVVAALLGFLFASWIIRPVTTMMAVSGSIEREEFELAPLEPLSHRTDELGQLARVIKTMASEVYAREQQMKQQLAELRIEIDEVKRKKQVEEIVDTDFFRELREKAQELRRRTGKSDA